MSKEELRDLLIKEAWEGLKNSYSPYSKFPVGAAVMGADGQVYRGCNIENVSYGLTVCGERNAIFNMVVHGVQDLHRPGGGHQREGGCRALRGPAAR